VAKKPLLPDVRAITTEDERSGCGLAKKTDLNVPRVKKSLGGKKERKKKNKYDRLGELPYAKIGERFRAGNGVDAQHRVLNRRKPSKGTEKGQESKKRKTIFYEEFRKSWTTRCRLSEGSIKRKGQKKTSSGKGLSHWMGIRSETRARAKNLSSAKRDQCDAAENPHRFSTGETEEGPWRHEEKGGETATRNRCGGQEKEQRGHELG